MTDRSRLFEPARLGDLTLPNRVLMAPLTRNRAHDDGTPAALAETYYEQRASAGLILTEATQISAMGKGYIKTPGIYTDDHVAAWKKITDAVHAGGGRIFVQLWHVGRISHSSLLPDGRAPVSSSDKAAEAMTFTANGFEPTSKPEALTEEGIRETIADYVTAAKAAKAAGFDGIEVHAANGYLIDQFLSDGLNDRTDAYGGSIENRMRFLNEVLEAVSDVWAADRIGVRLSPLGQANDMSDSGPQAHYGHVIEALNARGLAYLHMVEAFPGSEGSTEGRAIIDALRAKWTGFYIANGGYDGDSAAQALATGRADAVAFGRPFITNPDLPKRLRLHAPLNEGDGDTYYGGDHRGYTDYSFLEGSAAEEAA
ncbi:alkene reductase [Citreimonas salinaria]|uniref:N-ethylmaleimide reductase n=1 Tax=Citreimonas salinaria TaxID=321339 RepID=A0A1H3INI7_9RHOB|nr:alkene reductase [Citreimonas salinaria]SDY28384.1 N-ethylmaleimide reductase [Citreimonas salinaria]